MIVDNFRAHRASRFARDLEMNTRYHAQVAFEGALRDAGFVIIGRRETQNGVNRVYRCRKPAYGIAHQPTSEKSVVR